MKQSNIKTERKPYYIIQVNQFGYPHFCKSASRNLKTHSSIMGTFSGGEEFYAVRASDDKVLSCVKYFSEYKEYRYVTVDADAVWGW